MIDELNTLQETAAKAQAQADELKAALTDSSTDQDRAAADEAEKAATDAESAFAEAKAQADAEAAAQGDGAVTPKIGDVCTNAEGVAGTLQDDGTGSGNLVCVVQQQSDADPDASRTGVVEKPARTGDPCTCPDGRPGTVTVFADGLAICLPNQG